MNKGVHINVNGVTISLTQDQLNDISRQQRKLLPVMERIQTFEDIISEYGKPASYFSDPSLSADEIGYRKVKAIAEVYNEGWLADYKNKNQKKYYPYFEYNIASSSFGFSGTYCGCWAALADGGSRLCSFKTEELARDAATKFIKEYNEWLG